jgi:CBS domain-containing protein
MGKQMRVADFMSRRVVTVHPDAPVTEAAQLMLTRHFSGLPVVDRGGHVIGIVTEHDLLRRTNRPGSERPHWLQLMIERAALSEKFAQLDRTKVEDVMTRDPVMVTEDTPIEDASRLIESRGIKRLPVVQGDHLIGIISRADLVRALVASASKIAEMNERVAAAESLLLGLQCQSVLNRGRSPFG